jgi:hypothetical protein
MLLAQVLGAVWPGSTVTPSKLTEAPAEELDCDFSRKAQ